MNTWTCAVYLEEFSQCWENGNNFPPSVMVLTSPFSPSKCCELVLNPGHGRGKIPFILEKYCPLLGFAYKIQPE